MSQNSYFVVWFVWSWPIFRWIPGSFFHQVTSGCLEKVFLCFKNYQDFIKLRQENFLTCLDKILPRSYQGVPRNFVYQVLGKMCQVLHELARSCLTWQGVSSFVSLGMWPISEKAYLNQFCVLWIQLIKSVPNFHDLYTTLGT